MRITTYLKAVCRTIAIVIAEVCGWDEHSQVRCIRELGLRLWGLMEVQASKHRQSITNINKQ